MQVAKMINLNSPSLPGYSTLEDRRQLRVFANGEYASLEFLNPSWRFLRARSIHIDAEPKQASWEKASASRKTVLFPCLLENVSPS